MKHLVFLGVCCAVTLFPGFEGGFFPGLTGTVFPGVRDSAFPGIKATFFPGFIATLFPGLSAEEPTSEPQPIAASPEKSAKEMGVRVEPLSEELLKAGVTVEILRSELFKYLSVAQIEENGALAHPYLSLRVRTIQVGLDMATFFQLSFHEEAMLVRNRSIFNAMTWSQASLLSCRPEELKKEVLDTVDVMIQSFVKDFQKAIQPVS
jgi:hypothetical protein